MEMKAVSRALSPPHVQPCSPISFSTSSPLANNCSQAPAASPPALP